MENGNVKIPMPDTVLFHVNPYLRTGPPEARIGPKYQYTSSKQPSSVLFSILS
jgi:hypothetical protein